MYASPLASPKPSQSTHVAVRRGTGASRLSYASFRLCRAVLAHISIWKGQELAVHIVTMPDAYTRLSKDNGPITPSICGHEGHLVRGGLYPRDISTTGRCPRGAFRLEWAYSIGVTTHRTQDLIRYDRRRSNRRLRGAVCRIELRGAGALWSWISRTRTLSKWTTSANREWKESDLLMYCGFEG